MSVHQTPPLAEVYLVKESLIPVLLHKGNGKLGA